MALLVTNSVRVALAQELRIALRLDASHSLYSKLQMLS